MTHQGEDMKLRVEDVKLRAEVVKPGTTTDDREYGSTGFRIRPEIWPDLTNFPASGRIWRKSNRICRI